MKCNYRAPESRDKLEMERRITTYTRGCIFGTMVQTLYERFYFGEKRCTRFLDGCRALIAELEAENPGDHAAQCDVMRERIGKECDIDYGVRHLSGARQKNACAHDVMTMCGLLVLARDFGFGCKRSQNHKDVDPESRLSIFFDAMGKNIRYINRVNDPDTPVNEQIMFWDWLDDHLIGYGFSRKFVDNAIRGW